MVEIIVTGKYPVPGQMIKTATYEAGTLVEYEGEYADWLVEKGYAKVPGVVSQLSQILDPDLKVVKIPDVTPEPPIEPAGANLERMGVIGKSKGRRK